MNNENPLIREETKQLTIFDICPELEDFGKGSEPFENPEAGEEVHPAETGD
jgi:hypothetical protein